MVFQPDAHRLAHLWHKFFFFTLTNVGTNQSGNYTVQVFNRSGSLTSSNAVLTVIPQPTLALQFWRVIRC